MDWREAYHNFDTMEPLKPGDPRLHPELFGDFLNTVATRLSLNRNKNQKLLLSGHLGCGKSTFLNLLLEHQEIKDNFFTVKYSIKDILDPNDTDHIDLLLSLTLQTIIAAQEGRVKIDRALSRKVKDMARELQGLIRRKTEEVKGKRLAAGAGAKAGLGLTSLIPWFKPDFFARYQMENETREAIRQYYKPRMTDFLNTIRDLLDRIQVPLKNKSLFIKRFSKTLIGSKLLRNCKPLQKRPLKKNQLSLNYCICPPSSNIAMGRISGIDLTQYLSHGSAN